jgi:type IV secretion system protein VirB9
MKNTLTKALAVALIALMVPATAFAQGGLNREREVVLTPKEIEALRLADDWSNRPLKPIQSGGGKVVYVHGATMPTVIGSPMQISDIELEPGEVVNEILVGDSARWLVESGTSKDVTHIFVKPVDSGLNSSLVVTTNRRVYHMKLVSRNSGHTPYIGFLYDSQLQSVLAKDAHEKTWNAVQEGDRSMDMSNLNFAYNISGNASWRPERVYDDGQKMYVRLPDTALKGEVPVLLVRQGGADNLVNYRLKNNTYEVDGVFPHVILVAGVGNNKNRVEIKGS